MYILIYNTLFYNKVNDEISKYSNDVGMYNTFKEAKDAMYKMIEGNVLYLKTATDHPEIYLNKTTKEIFNEYMDRDNILKDISISIIEPYLTRQGSVKNHIDYVNEMNELRRHKPSDFRIYTRAYVSQRIYEYDIQNDVFKTFEIFGNGEEESHRREETDYLPEAGTKFKLGEEVKVKGFRNESIFIIESTPKFDIPNWENTYSIYLKGYKSNWYEDIHEVDLIKIKGE